MIYLKYKNNDIELKVDIYEDDLFSQCTECGKEMQVDGEMLKLISSDGDFAGTSFICCNCNSQKDDSESKIDNPIEQIEEMFYIAKEKIDLNSWQPTEKDIEKAKQYIKEHVICLVEDCDEYEDAKAYLDLIIEIEKTKEMKRKKTLIQQYIAELHQAVPEGTIGKYHGKEIADFIKKILGITSSICNISEYRNEVD